MDLFSRKVRPDQEIASSLGLRPGDIILTELPYEDAQRQDFEKFHDISPSHSGVWAGDHLEKPFARSNREIYTPPGLQLTNIWEGRHVVFRYTDKDTARIFAKIMENWSSGHRNQIFAQNDYEFHIGKDVLYLFQAEQPKLSHNGILLALCFAALRECLGEPHYKPGQRCTAMLTAAFQASLLVPIVRSHKDRNHFVKIQNHTVHSFLDEISVSNWHETPFGIKLHSAIQQNRFDNLFPKPFSLDLHYASPRILYEKLKDAVEFFQVGFFSFFENEIVSIVKDKLE